VSSFTEVVPSNLAAESVHPVNFPLNKRKKIEEFFFSCWKMNEACQAWSEKSILYYFGLSQPTYGVCANAPTYLLPCLAHLFSILFFGIIPFAY
jgi:hypothetical protein